MKSGPKGSRFYDNHIYAAYRGDEYLMDGTLEEISKATGKSRKNLQWLLSPYGKRRADRCITNCEKAGRKSMVFNLTLIDDE